MSYCVVHMQKMKMSALGGIQSHNQREHPSKKNHDIDYTKSRHNIDLVNYDQINYQRAVKERIEELKLGKAVRKDAVVYSSFIVSSAIILPSFEIASFSSTKAPLNLSVSRGFSALFFTKRLSNA